MKKTILKNTLLLSALCVGVADSVCGGDIVYEASDGRASAQDGVCLTAEDVDVSYEKASYVDNGRLGIVWISVFGHIMHAMNITMDRGAESIREYLQKECKGCDIVLGNMIQAFDATGFPETWSGVMYRVNRSLHVSLPGSLIPVSGGDKNVWCDNVLERVDPLVVNIIHEAHMWVLRRLGEVDDVKDVEPCVKSCESIDKESAAWYMQSALELLRECVQKATDSQAYESDWEQRARNVLFARSKACRFGDALTGEGVLLCLSNIDELNRDYFRLTDIDDAKYAAALLVDGLPKDELAEKMIRSVQGGSKTVDKEDEHGEIVVDPTTGEPSKEELKYPPVTKPEEARKVLSYFCDFMCLAALWEERCYINPYRVNLLRELFEDAVNGSKIVKNYKRSSAAKASMSEEVVEAFKAVLALMRKGYDCSEEVSSSESSEDESFAALSAGGEGSSTHRSVSKNTLTEALSNKDVKLCTLTKVLSREDVNLSTEGVKEYIHDLAALLSNHFDVLHNTNAEKQLIADAKEILTVHALSLVFNDVSKHCFDISAFCKDLERRALEMRDLEEDVDTRSPDMSVLSGLRDDVKRIKEIISPEGDEVRLYKRILGAINACIETQLSASNVIRIRQYIERKLIEDRNVVNDAVIKTYAQVISGEILSQANDILNTLSGLNLDVVPKKPVSAFKSQVEEWQYWADALVSDESASNVNSLLNLFDQREIFVKGGHLCFLANQFMDAYSKLNGLFGDRQDVEEYNRKANDLHQKVLEALSKFGQINLDVLGNSEANAPAKASMEVCYNDVARVLAEMQALLAAFSGDVELQIPEEDGCVPEHLMLNMSTSHTIAVSADAKDDSISDTIEPQPGIEQSVAQDAKSVADDMFEAIVPGASTVMANNAPANDHNGQTEIVVESVATGRKEVKAQAALQSARSPELQRTENSGSVQETSVQKGIAPWTKKKHVMVWGSVALTLICCMIAPFFIGGSSIAMIVFVAMGGTGSVSAILSSVFVK